MSERTTGQNAFGMVLCVTLIMLVAVLTASFRLARHLPALLARLTV